MSRTLHVLRRLLWYSAHPGAACRKVRFRRNPKQALADRETFFTHVFHDNYWGNSESVSGCGSTLEATRLLRAELPQLLGRLNAQSLLDVPCGDFHWMKTVDLGAVQYTGGDIVADLVASNQKKFSAPGRNFEQLDLVQDRLPPVDLVLCRDCLVHMFFQDILGAVGNLVASGSKYLLTTTFPSLGENADLETHTWRPLNLQLPPFNFPAPLELVEDFTPGASEQAPAKYLGLWRLADLAPVGPDSP